MRSPSSLAVVSKIRLLGEIIMLLPTAANAVVCSRFHPEDSAPHSGSWATVWATNLFLKLIQIQVSCSLEIQLCSLNIQLLTNLLTFFQTSLEKNRQIFPNFYSLLELTVAQNMLWPNKYFVDKLNTWKVIASVDFSLFSVIIFESKTNWLTAGMEEDPRNDKIYSLGNWEEKKGQGQRGTRNSLCRP